MNVLFDYMYYRMTRLFLKSDGLPGIRSFLLLSLFQGLILSILFILLMRFVDSRIGPLRYRKLSGGFALGVFILLNIYNNVRYKGKYDYFDSKWGGEAIGTKRMRGLLIIIIMSLPFLAFLLYDRIDKPEPAEMNFELLHDD